MFRPFLASPCHVLGQEYDRLPRHVELHHAAGVLPQGPAAAEGADPTVDAMMTVVLLKMAIEIVDFHGFSHEKW